MPETLVETRDALIRALTERVDRIVVRGDIDALPTIRLNPGVRMRGCDATATVRFQRGQDGICLTTDNDVFDLSVHVDPERRAVFNASEVGSLGLIQLRRVRAVGQVQLLIRDAIRSGHLNLEDLTILDADTRERLERPFGNGITVLQGAVTLWNQHQEAINITAELDGVSIGSADRPIRGSGLFVAGIDGPSGGRIQCQRVSTGAVYIDSALPVGTADTVAGGVFILHGAEVSFMVNQGPLTTRGPNAVPLDNWGDVRQWVAEDDVTSHGPSAIGVINAGRLDELRVLGIIETFGAGARGIGIYADIGKLVVQRIVTHGDGAAGVQIVAGVDELIVLRGIEARGGVGTSLVKGVIEPMAADGLYVDRRGAIREASIAGGIVTMGDGCAAVRVAGGIGYLRVTGVTAAAGSGSIVLEIGAPRNPSFSPDRGNMRSV